MQKATISRYPDLRGVWIKGAGWVLRKRLERSLSITYGADYFNEGGKEQLCSDECETYIAKEATSDARMRNFTAHLKA